MLAVAILAAGKGTRMKSSLPKVLQPLAGISLIERVLKTLNDLAPEKTLLVVGHQAEQIKEHLNHLQTLEYVTQEPQLGTGHALQKLLPVLKDFQGDLLVLNGDVPLLSPSTIQHLVSKHRSNNADVTLLTARLSDPTGYGRVFTNNAGQIKEIIEHKDCNPEQKNNNLTNSGIYCFNWHRLSEVLPKLESNNNQGELYLTDTVAMLSSAVQVEVMNPNEVQGINDHCQLAQCEALIQERLRKKVMLEGVTFIDPYSCTISENCLFGRDVVIEPQTHLRGACDIGNNCRVGPGSLLENAILDDDVNVFYSVIRNAKVGKGSAIGPFSHLRPKAEVADMCRIGNFVEIKGSHIGTGSKVNHLSYIGDADLGQDVNIGAGTITANYDGINKHRTVIGERSKTGANSVLVAPIVLGSNVTVGAGSTLTKSVPNNALAIERTKQSLKLNWKVRGTTQK